MGNLLARLAKTTIALLLLVLAGGVVASAQQLPSVQLDANGMGPRTIEQLTGSNIARNYALAWRSMADALEQNRADLLNDQFTGFAKDQLTQRIEDQGRSGLHVKLTDHGHHLKGIFYSQGGDAMQLIDEAQVEVQVFDGAKLIYSDTKPQRYLVLMTPGADRWYVRSLDSAKAAASQ